MKTPRINRPTSTKPTPPIIPNGLSSSAKPADLSPPDNPLTPKQKKLLRKLLKHLPNTTYALCKLLRRDMMNQSAFKGILKRLALKGYLDFYVCDGVTTWTAKDMSRSTE